MAGCCSRGTLVFCAQLYSSVLATFRATGMARRGRKPSCTCGECKKCRRRVVVQRYRARKQLRPEQLEDVELLRRRKIEKKPSGPKVCLHTEQARTARERTAKYRRPRRTKRATAPESGTLGFDVFLTRTKKECSRVGTKYQAEIPAIQSLPVSMRATERQRAGSRVKGADAYVCLLQ